MVDTVAVEFAGGSGARLAGRLDMPEHTPTAYALLAHCFTCSKDHKGIRWISRTLAEAGIAALRFDFTGLGDSGGEFIGTTFTSNVHDLMAAADFLRQQYAAPGLLVGHSFGGAAVIAAAPRIPEVRAVTAIAAPSDVQHLRDLLLAQAPDLEQHGEAEVQIVGRSFRIGRDLVEDLEAYCVADMLDKLNRPLLLLHSPVDAILSIVHARRLFEMAREPKSLISLNSADHLFSREEDAVWAGQIIAAWSRRYVTQVKT